MLFQNMSNKKLKDYTIFSGTEKTLPSRHLAQLSIWRGGLYIVYIDTQLKSLKIIWVQRLLNPINALWKDLMFNRLNSILNSNQGLVLFRQKQILRSNKHRNLQKQNNKDFFTQLLNAWLHFTINNKKLLNNPYF